MKNRKTGALLLLLAFLTLSVAWEMNSYISRVHGQECQCVGSCPMAGDVPLSVLLGVAISAVLLLLGISLIRTQPERGPKLESALKKLKPEERKVMELIVSEKAIFQGEIVERTGFSKSKVSRTLDLLEGKRLAERKRRGMSNVVVLKAD